MYFLGLEISICGLDSQIIVLFSLFPTALRGKLNHALDVTLIDDIDERFDDAEARSKVHGAYLKNILSLRQAVHPKQLIGLGPSGAALGYGGYRGYGGYAGFGRGKIKYKWTGK